MERTIVERCALSSSDLRIKFRTILLTSTYIHTCIHTSVDHNIVNAVNEKYDVAS